MVGCAGQQQTQIRIRGVFILLFCSFINAPLEVFLEAVGNNPISLLRRAHPLHSNSARCVTRVHTQTQITVSVNHGAVSSSTEPIAEW